MITQLDLYNIKPWTPENHDWYRLTAYLREDGSLKLEGQDFSELAEHMFGDEEYEYFLTFSVEETNKLKELLHTDDLLPCLKETFFTHGNDNNKFLDFCAEHGITYTKLVI